MATTILNDMFAGPGGAGYTWQTPIQVAVARQFGWQPSNPTVPGMDYPYPESVSWPNCARALLVAAGFTSGGPGRVGVKHSLLRALALEAAIAENNPSLQDELLTSMGLPLTANNP